MSMAERRDVPGLGPAIRGAIGRAWRAGLIAVSLVLLVGIVEVLVLLVKRHLTGEFIWVAREFTWMTPVSYLYHLRYIVAGLVLIATLLPKISLPYLVVLPITFLGSYSLLMLSRGIHFVALGLIAAGVSVQVSRWSRNHPAGLDRFARWGTASMIGLMLTFAVGHPGLRNWKERRALADLPAAKAGAPNVLLIILDTVRGASSSLSGYPRRTTPMLERWAKQGVVFHRAYAPAPWTLPSHATLLTGRYAHELTTDWLVGLDPETPTLAEVLAARGYQTAGFSANQGYVSFETGLTRGFAHFEDARVSREQMRLSSSIGQLRAYQWKRLPFRRYDRKWGEDINASVLAWLDKRSGDAPFFIFINNFDAHTPNYGRQAFLAQVGGLGEDRDRALYDAGVARADYYVGTLLDSLERRGLLENTVVLITSDHGEFLGEHGLTKHGNALYEEVLRVPFLLLGTSRVPDGIAIQSPITLRDVPATLLDLIAAEPGHGMPGHSLARFWSSERRDTGDSPIISTVRRGINTPPDEPVTRGDMWSLIEGTWHYILNGDGSEEFYDLAQDPGEAHNLAQHDAVSAILTRLRETVAQARRSEDSLLAAGRQGNPGDSLLHIRRQ